MVTTMRATRQFMIRTLIVYLTLPVLHSGAQTMDRQVRALRPADTARREAAILDDLEWRAGQVLASVPHATTSAQADLARPVLRNKLAHSLGFGQLNWPPALQARTVGVV